MTEELKTRKQWWETYTKEDYGMQSDRGKKEKITIEQYKWERENHLMLTPKEWSDKQ